MAVLGFIFAFTLNSQAQKTDQQITFNNLPQKTFGDASFELSATSTSGLTVSFLSSNIQVATISGNMVTIIGAGETIITASQAGDDNFNPAELVTQTLVVRKADQSISFSPLPTLTYSNNGTLFLFATSSTGLPVIFSSNDENVATTTGSTLFIKGAGECTITAKQSGNSNYNETSVEQQLIINKASQFITFSSMSARTYGDSPFGLIGSTSSMLDVQYTSSNPTLVSIEGQVVTIHGAGTIEITASQPGTSNYLPAANVIRTLVVNKAPQPINFTSIPPKTYGDLPFTLIANSISGLPIRFSSQYDTLLTLQGNTATIIGAGILKVYAIQDGNENYLPYTAEQTLTINKASQTITFGPLPSKAFGDPPFAVSATSTSGLPVSITSNRKTVAKVSGNSKITIFGAGTAPIVAAQEGNSNYLAAADVIQPLIVSGLGNSYPLVGITRNGGNGSGTIFKMNTDGTGFNIEKNFMASAFNSPQGGLIKASNGKLYGMIYGGGVPANGVVFSINPDGTEYAIIHNFSFTDGQRPFGNVMEASNGYLYGMTYDGGANNTGVLFRIQKDGSEFSKLHEFPGAGENGYHPLGGLIEADNGDLYGMTNEGGAGAYGVLFTIKKDGADFTILHEFSTSTGASPRGDLLQGPDGYLYGLASKGGIANLGVLFKIKTDGTEYTKLVEFDGPLKGSTPGASLILADNGKLYGVTQLGGSHQYGTLFSVNTDGTAFTKLHDFNISNAMGTTALATLVQSSADGYLYGMTNQGGNANLGVTFKIKTDGTDFTKLFDFYSSNGATPVFGPLLEVEPGSFYGMTSKGGFSNAGLIFSVTALGDYTKVKEFPQPVGNPEMISSGDGKQFFGIASKGGPTGNGVIFKTEADGSGYEKLIDLTGDFFFSEKIIHTSDNSLWGIGVEGINITKNVLFHMNTDGTNFHRIEFDNAVDLGISWLIEGPNQYLYGAGYIGLETIIFRFKTDGTNFTNLGVIPEKWLIANLELNDQGELFGLTSDGGDYNRGTVFKFNINTIQYQRIFSFQEETSGAYQKKIIVLNDGSLCVATASGGPLNSGTIFSINTDGGEYSKIFDFPSSYHLTDLMQTVDGYLVGSTREGGANGHGVIFEMLTDGSDFKAIQEFDGTNGSSPTSLHFRRMEQTISFESIPVKMEGDAPFELRATNSSNVPMTFTSSDESIASIDGATVTVHQAGEVIITASAPESVNFVAAQVQQPLFIEEVITALDEEIIGKVHFYPNPANDKISIDISKLTGEVRVQIIDNLGRKLEEKTTIDRIIEMNTSDLPKGHYIIKVSSRKRTLSLHLLKN